MKFDHQKDPHGERENQFPQTVLWSPHESTGLSIPPHTYMYICTKNKTSFLKVKEEKSRNKILSTRERTYNFQSIFISNDWHMTKNKYVKRQKEKITEYKRWSRKHSEYRGYFVLIIILYMSVLLICMPACVPGAQRGQERAWYPWNQSHRGCKLPCRC